MNMTFYPSESTKLPLEVDDKSSENFVFIRQNIREVEVEDHSSGGKFTMYRYEEAKITRIEYQQHQMSVLKKENDSLKAQLAEQADALVELASLIG